MSIAGRNLRYLRKLRDLTQEEFAHKLSIKRSLLGAYEEERAEPRIEVLEQVSDLFKLTLDDLLLKDLSEPRGNYLAKRRAQKMAAAINQIYFVPVKAAAGYLAGYEDPAFLDELNTFTLPMLAPGSYRAFEIVGDSMMPTPSGSVVVGERVEDLEEVKPNHAYIVISRREGIVYKRVYKNNKSRQQLTLVSDNPDYQPYQMDASEVMELWKASLIISKPETQPRWDVSQLASLVNNLSTQVSQLKKKIN